MQRISQNCIKPKQTRAIAYLLTCRTIGEAAEQAKVSERTLHAWLKDHNFRIALREAEKQTVDIAIRRLISGQSKALDTLENLMSTARHESTRRQAAVDWLNFLLRYRNLIELDERITNLERQLTDDKINTDKSAGITGG